MIEYGINSIGKNVRIFEPVTIGFPSRDNINKSEFIGTIIGDNAVLRSGSIFYCDVVIGKNFQCGHNVLIREHTHIVDDVAIGTATIIEGNVSIGSKTVIQSNAYIPTNTIIGSQVFIAPHVVITNDKYPPTKTGGLTGAYIHDGAIIGANATLLPGVSIGDGALVSAGAVVTRNVPNRKMAIGAPARIEPLPEAYHER